MHRYLGAFILSAALVAPVVVVKAADHDRDDQKRYYDSYRHDYHQWNQNEDRAYRRYLEDQNQQYRDWARANRRDQTRYWRWRHSHPDNMLWNNNGERSRSDDRNEHRDRDRH